MITDDQLRQIMPTLAEERRTAYLPILLRALEEFNINTPLRVAAFLAQLAHESGEFKWMQEIWGPTKAQKNYEPPAAKARELGNTEPGDGHRFRGRGPIQITGRANYQKYGDLLGLDLVTDPGHAADPEVGFRTAGLYWQRNGCNELADAQKFVSITRRINGGTNGLADRQRYYERAKKALDTITRELPRGASEAEDEASITRDFTRGLDAPGELTPTAAERNVPEEKAGRKAGARKAAGKKAAKGAKAAKAAKAGGAKRAAGRETAKKAGGKKAAKGAAKAGAKKAAKKAGTKKGAKKAAKGTAKKSGARKGAAKGAAKKGATKKAGPKKGTKKTAKGSAKRR